ncbi:caspase, EACC1-associated type [Actinoplanes xinjiangensis]|uniref:caspase, EACC1-associated type n=1 Tax=Actinoplanes xinjiangensis TaxID=512350 RepID=UPI00342794F9
MERAALLIASGNYDDESLSKLRSPSGDAAALTEVLNDKGIGSFAVRCMVDEPHWVISEAIEEFFHNRYRDDLLLLHISCHGIKDRNGRLFFATRTTRRDRIASTTVSADFLRAQMEGCRARTIIVLIDCCYSGAYLAGAKADQTVYISEELTGRGRAVLTATDRLEYGYEGTDIRAFGEISSRFTAEVIEGLRSGAADLDQDGRVTVNDLYKYLYNRLRGMSPPQSPQLFAELEYDPVIATVPAEISAMRRKSTASEAVSAPVDPTVPLRAFRKGLDIIVFHKIDLKDVMHGDSFAFTYEVWQRCENCDGDGSCLNCGNSRRVWRKRSITMKIPVGVEGGMQIRLVGIGDVKHGGKGQGHLFVALVEQPHEIIVRSKNGVDLEMPISVSEPVARKGGVLVIDLIGEVINVRIPPGIDQMQRVRIRGKGVPKLKSDVRGDLYLIAYKQDF